MNADRGDAGADRGSPPPRSGMAATPRRTLLLYGLLLAGATAAVFLAAGPPQGALGIFLACAGVALIFCPPQNRVDGRIWLAAGGVVAGSAMALLPERWFGVPAWRRVLEASPAISLATTVSTVPWQTTFWLALLALTLVIVLSMLAHPLRSGGLLACAVAAALVCGLYASLAIYAKQSAWRYPFPADADFGFFPNRNHTATFLVTGSVLAMGVLGVVLPRRRWVLAFLAAATLALCVVALLFFSSSRGGVVFLLVGALLWTAGLGHGHRNVPVIVSIFALMVAGGILFWVSGSQVRDRFLHPRHSFIPPVMASSGTPPRQARAAGSGDTAQNLPFDFRLLIYRDTLDLIQDFPLTGAGLGAFGGDFMQYRKASLSDSAAIHPESDWLLFTAEAGLPALLCLLGLVLLLLAPLRTLTTHPFWPLRWGCVVAAGAASLHGLVDVPVHRVALGWWIVVVAGLGLPVSPGREVRRSRVQHGIFVLAGLGSLVMGIQLLRAEWFGGVALPPFAAPKMQAEILATFRHQDLEGALKMAREAVKSSPMSGPLYYQCGVLLLRFENTDAEVDDVFQAQRLLNPDWPDIALQQGEGWKAIDPKRTAMLWLEAFRRRLRIDQARDAAPAVSLSYYVELLQLAKPFPDVQQDLIGPASQGPAYTLAWMSAANPGVFCRQIKQLTTDAIRWRDGSEADRQRFLLLWYGKGDRAALSHFVEDQPAWAAAAWIVHLHELVDGRNFAQAVREAADHYQVSLALPVPARAGEAVGVPPPDDEVVEAFVYYWRTGNTVAARRVLDEAGKTADASSLPARYWQFRAALAMQDSAWEAAWQALKTCLSQEHAAGVLP